jgi:predicted phosphate transport protein (TIGR00153 family)
MVSRQDRIADYAQNVAEQLSFRPLMEDETALENLIEMSEIVSKTIAKYEDLIEALRQYHISGRTKAGVDEVYALIREVNLVEHEADGVEAKAAAYVFSNGDDEPLAAMHMYRVLQRLDDVANAAEKAANALLPLLRR